MNKTTATWMSLGTGFGLVWAMVTDQNTGTGIALGAGVGLVLGTAMAGKSKEEPEPNVAAQAPGAAEE